MAANQYPFGVGRLPADALNLAIAEGRRVGVVARRVAVQAVATGSAGAAQILWDTEDYDSDNFLVPTSGTITIRVAGIYAITAHIDTAAATGVVLQQISAASSFPNSPGLYRSYTPSGEPFGLVSATARFLVGDTFSIVVQHGAGVSKNYVAFLQCWRVSS